MPKRKQPNPKPFKEPDFQEDLTTPRQDLGKILIFGTSNFANPLIPGKPGQFTDHRDRLMRFESRLSMNISLYVTYQLEQLENALNEDDRVKASVAAHNTILLHCLGNDMRILLTDPKIIKKKAEIKQDHLFKANFHVRYANIIQDLIGKGKTVFVSLLLPRTDLLVSTALFLVSYYTQF